MAKPKLGLAILWHQHQPYYRNSKGVYQMPWVRFHGTKDYLDFLLVLKEFPKVKQNFNLVPSLLEQIEDYVQNDAIDNILELTIKPANKLQPDEKNVILKDFFMANVNNMIKPYPRYYELYLKSKSVLESDGADRKFDTFSTEDYRDLQVWYNLCWIGMESRKKTPVNDLFKKGKLFSEEDKRVLIQEIRNILGQIIPLHKELWENNQIELSTSPYYHPILPLVCDNYIGQESSPEISLPQNQFRHPEDAEVQLQKGLQYFEKIFGKMPNGIWPSEGSVSMEALELIANQEVRWTATDEGILANTLKKDYSHLRIYQPYEFKFGERNLKIFFRDHYLSDAIGFVYSNWSAEQAVADLKGRIYAIRKMLIDNYGEQSLSNYVVPIILDGENCWEYYEGDGKPFLRKLFQALYDDELIESVTLSEALDRNQKNERLSSIFPGSWINSNFNIWIGAEEDNKSWDVLSQTRQFLITREKEGIYPADVIEKAWDQIYISEGSDWNWWYGDEHSSANDMEFDLLYREHLMEVYRLLDAEIPSNLYQTIKRVHHDRFVSSRPKNFIHPVIDGRHSHFYEWVGAAIYDIGKTAQSSMHQVTRILERLYVGFNDKKLYLRLDFTTVPDPLAEFIIAIKRPKSVTLVVSPLRGVMERYDFIDHSQKKSNLDPTFKLDHILELAVSFDALDIQAGEILGFQIQLKLSGQSLEEYPRMNLIELEVPSNEFDLKEWSV